MRACIQLLAMTLLTATACGAGTTLATALPWPEADKDDVARLEAELRRDLPAETFLIQRAGPWLVATDLTRQEAATFIESTIKDFGGLLQKQLFTKTPRKDPVKVYLFKDGESYNAWNKKLFNEKPGTPYGYYSRARRALVMNIGTGGGTLIHEMVHAMAEADFPEIPAWLNEGLGSLYECCLKSRDGRIMGATNWRLQGLQSALAKDTAPKFSELLSISDKEFYGDNSGVNYAAARYLMQWLQTQGKLEPFYVRIRDKQNATPQAALRAVFADKLALPEIEQRCYGWVKTLNAR